MVRKPPGAMVRYAPVIPAEIGNSADETMRMVPPGDSFGACARSRNLWVCGASCSAPSGRAVASVAGTLPGPMYNSPLGSLANAASGNPKFCARTCGGVSDVQSVTLNVPYSEKCPLSKMSTKWHSPGPSPWIECAYPRGKYHTSPGPKLLTSLRPSGSNVVVWHRPVSTNAHSAASACQCNSRIAPGCRRIDTPARPSATGICLTVDSFAVPAAYTRPVCDSIGYRKDGSGSGGSPSSLAGPAGLARRAPSAIGRGIRAPRAATPPSAANSRRDSGVAGSETWPAEPDGSRSGIVVLE